MGLSRTICTLLVCCSALWVISSSSKAPAAPGCTSWLLLPSEDGSLARGSRDVHSRSLSTWRWRVSSEKNRIPVDLWEAECSSSFCSGPNPRHRGAFNLNSVPVYQNLLVLTRQNGSHCYTASYRSVAVGCTCVWARTFQKLNLS